MSGSDKRLQDSQEGLGSEELVVCLLLENLRYCPYK